MKPKAYKPLRFASIIAAFLVILIVIGVVAFNDTSNPEHPFILTVGAEEITPETYIKFGDTVNVDNSFNYTLHGYLDENRNFIKTDDYADLTWVRKDFNVELNCEGENIESITYKAVNGYLNCYKYCLGLIDYTPLTTDEVMKYSTTGTNNNFKKVSDCTFDYNNQPKSAATEDDKLNKTANSADGSIPLRISFSLEFEEDECVLPIDENYLIDTNEAFQKEFNVHAEEFGLIVTANFKDGTSTTKTIKFRCDESGNQIYLSATEAIS